MASHRPYGVRETSSPHTRESPSRGYTGRAMRQDEKRVGGGAR
jgi:hypothetical protein